MAHGLCLFRVDGALSDLRRLDARTESTDVTGGKLNTRFAACAVTSNQHTRKRPPSTFPPIDAHRRARSEPNGLPDEILVAGSSSPKTMPLWLVTTPSKPTYVLAEDFSRHPNDICKRLTHIERAAHPI